MHLAPITTDYRDGSVLSGKLFRSDDSILKPFNFQKVLEINNVRGRFSLKGWTRQQIFDIIAIFGVDDTLKAYAKDV